MDVVASVAGRVLDPSRPRWPREGGSEERAAGVHRGGDPARKLHLIEPPRPVTTVVIAGRAAHVAGESVRNTSVSSTQACRSDSDS